MTLVGAFSPGWGEGVLRYISNGEVKSPIMGLKLALCMGVGRNF